ncbi:MAG: hypothetical protein HY589_03040 [Candidatus Omnitrophica bacterium]|nr:hypothetical protein [Candidatus Omnitrophota bacterium]
MMSRKCQKKDAAKNGSLKTDVASYRLKCAKTANGLSHFVMYGDVPKKKTLV